MDSRELPDHLVVMLAFAALAPAGHGEALLAEHRPAIELLRLSLHDLRSPYGHVLDALAAVLGPLTVTDRAAVARLAQEGPPDEAVGLEPYGPPDIVGARA
jgi:nitrate reductase delta subunit